MFGPQERSFKRSGLLDAPIERVWAALFDPQAMLWMAGRSVLAVAVPGDAEAVGALRCSWRQQRNGWLSSLVFEVIHVERTSRVILLERQTPGPHSHIEFRVEPHRDATTATVIVTQQRRRYEWGGRYTALVNCWVDQLLDGLRLAVACVGPQPPAPQSLFSGPTDNVQEQRQQVSIKAPVDEIWRLVEDEGDTLLPDPDRIHQWRVSDNGAELFLNVVSMQNEALTCTVSQIVRHDPLHVTTRGSGWETVHQLTPGTDSHLLQLTYRWSESLKWDRAAVAEAGEAFLAAVKTTATPTS